MLLYSNQSVNEPSKDIQLVDLTLNMTVSFIFAGIHGTYCTRMFAKRSRVYLPCFGGNLFTHPDESKSDSWQDLSLGSLSVYSTFLPLA